MALLKFLKKLFWWVKRAGLIFTAETRRRGEKGRAERSSRRFNSASPRLCGKIVFSICRLRETLLPFRKNSFQLFRLASLSVGLLFLVTLNSVRAQSPEYKVKAAYLFNFLQFVDWPTNAFASETSPLIIGVLGEDPFGKILDETMQGEVVKNRKLQVRRFKNYGEIRECHILFISGSELSNLKPILASLKGRSILTVSDTENFVRNGGMIRFVSEKNKIRFRINLSASKEAHVFISSKLLQLAEIVETEKRP